MNRKLRCVLLVEDNYMTNLYNEKIIEELCIANHVVSIEDGEEALNFLEHTQKNNSPPELILVDIYMPHMSGWEFIDKYRKMSFEKLKSSVIIILTHSRNPENEKMARSIPGVVDFLTKPLSGNALIEIIKKHFLDAIPIR